MRKTKKYKFPTPSSCKLKDRAVLCTAQRVLALYNQELNGDAMRIAKNVKSWFTSQAISRGWGGVIFLPEVQSGHGAGCVLFLPNLKPNVSIVVKSTTLVLEADNAVV